MLRVHVHPRSVRDEIVGWRAAAPVRGGSDLALHVRVTAPPLDGRANEAVCRLLAAALGVAPSTVELVRGAAARDKLFRLRTLDVTAARARLGASAPPPASPRPSR